MKCPYCGYDKVQPNFNFCPKCKRSLKEQNETKQYDTKSSLVEVPVEKTFKLISANTMSGDIILNEKVSAENFIERLNPNSWVKVNGYVEASLANTQPGDKYQFIRNGYYTTDKESKGNELIFNRTVSLKSSFSI